MKVQWENVGTVAHSVFLGGGPPPFRSISASGLE